MLKDAGRPLTTDHRHIPFPDYVHFPGPLDRFLPECRGLDEIAVDHRVILDALRGIAGVREVRRVRTRGRPDQVFVDIEVAVQAEMTVRESHEIADHIEKTLKTANPRISDVVVHVEPLT